MSRAKEDDRDHGTNGSRRSDVGKGRTGGDVYLFIGWFIYGFFSVVVEPSFCKNSGKRKNSRTRQGPGGNKIVVRAYARVDTEGQGVDKVVCV